MAIAAAGSVVAPMLVWACSQLRALELDFIPLFEERYVPAIPCHYWDSPLLAPPRQALASFEYRQAVANMGGYDVERMGEEM